MSRVFPGEKVTEMIVADGRAVGMLIDIDRNMNPLAIFVGAMSLLMVLCTSPLSYGEPPKSSKSPKRAAPAAPVRVEPVTARVLGEELTEAFAYQLRQIVLARLLERYAAEEKITATEAEVTRCARILDRFQQGMADSPDAIKQREAVLASKFLTKEERANEKSILKESRKSRQEQEKRVKSGERGEEISEMIQQTKVDQALHKRFGGRVALQGGQLSVARALDAQRDFLKEQENKGAFKILDEKLRQEFWAQDKMNEVQLVLTNEAWAVESLKNPWWTRATDEQLEQMVRRESRLLSYAEKRRQEGKFEAALDFCAREIRLYPDEEYPFAWRAGAYLERKQLDKALADARRAAKMTPSGMCFVLGEVLEALGKPEEALPHYQAYFDAYGAADGSAVKLARCLISLKKYEEAAVVLEKILSAGTSVSPIWGLQVKDVEDAQKMLGNVKLVLNDYAAAEEIYTKVIERSVLDSEAWRGRARARQGLKKDSEAAADLRMVAQLELEARARENEATAAGVGKK